MSVEVGIIGGSGFYEMDGFEPTDVVRPDTPFGKPSSEIAIGQIDGVTVAFVARHGSGHRVPPSRVPYRANVLALKDLGAHTVIGVNAVGSLAIEHAPGELALPDDILDRTHDRSSSFFGEGLVVHVGFAEPFCNGAREALLSHASAVATPVRPAGALVVVEGPRFSTRAESRWYRSTNSALIGMTTMPEAVLAREAETCYASVCVVTDYDVWHESEETVSVDVVLRTLRKSVHEARSLVRASVTALAARDDCRCRHALADAITTAPDAVDSDVARPLRPLVGRYLSES